MDKDNSQKEMDSILLYNWCNQIKWFLIVMTDNAEIFSTTEPWKQSFASYESFNHYRGYINNVYGIRDCIIFCPVKFLFCPVSAFESILKEQLCEYRYLIKT